MASLTPWHVSFGLRLRKARRRARYSTRHVSRIIEDRFQLQLSHGSIARIERGEQRLSIGMLGVLCSIYEIPPLQVAVGVEPPDDATWHLLVRAGLEQRVVGGIVWLEQMLDHGFARVDPDQLPAVGEAD
ncbi:MAG: helix-turn-helix domain-containing protein [Acidobacteriota bacterium]|nr:helix-turn-helix domain-containing protein [Acidobacteriota bacterium]